ncbi:MAG: hypothetical protein IKL24_01585 [Clostridia bacterium]|nr:hypothetical protein [Clostridia bacterium]
MYSKAKGMPRCDASPIPPPGYDGSRFRKRNDGRDEAFLAAYAPPAQPSVAREKLQLHRDIPTEEPEKAPEEIICEEDVTTEAEECVSAPSTKELSLGIGNEELLLIALILILAGEGSAGTEAVLLLTLLLCIS